MMTTVGALRASGHQQKTLKHEMRDNLLDALRAGRDPWPGLHGFADDVVPQLERAVIAGHDVVLLGERGQGKTRLLRTLVGLLDEWTPVIAGSELGEHPYEPITAASRRRAEEFGDALPVEWRHRDERYAEKLATPDTSVADLIGDVGPGFGAAQFPLVENHHDGATGRIDSFRQALVLVGDAFGGIDDEQGHIG